ncbi:hypothetical protein [Nostoc sp.]|uniref:hypothetical protein n=1 Tax=Nostoc sp. TaxID=1180 RepID=UPI002FF946E4
MGEVQRRSRTRYRYANGKSRRSDFSPCRASCYNKGPLRWTSSPTCSRSVSLRRRKWRGNPSSPVGDATRTGDATHSRYRYANTSCLRRETHLQCWIHRNALASLRLERFAIP